MRILPSRSLTKITVALLYDGWKSGLATSIIHMAWLRDKRPRAMGAAERVGTEAGATGVGATGVGATGVGATRVRAAL
jgi:hypothetical protein